MSILGAAALLGLAAWLLLPLWLAGPGLRMASAALGREIRVDEVRFQPWRLGLALDGLQIAGSKAGQPPLLSIAHVEATLSLRSIWHASPVLSSLRIDRPVLRLTRLSAGHYDIDDLLARFTQPAPDADAGPVQMGLYNIQLQQGQVLLDDRPVGRRHEVSALALDLPALSTLDADVALAVQPQLRGKVNGVDFGSEARLLPFGEKPQAKLDFNLAGLDLAPYLPYLPETLPLRLRRGRVDARLSLNFAHSPKQAPTLQLSGQLVLRDMALARPDGQPWLDWRELSIELKDVQPLRRQFGLGAVRWTGPSLALSTDATGQLWLPRPRNEAAPSPAAAPWRLGVDSFELSQAALNWRDASLPKPAVLRLEDVHASARGLGWPMKGQASVPLHYGLRLPPPQGKGEAALLKGEGSLSEARLSLDVRWQDLALESLAPWLQAHAQAPAVLRGRSGGRVELAVRRPFEADPVLRSDVSLRDLQLAQLALAAAPAGEPLLSAAMLQLDEARIDLGARQIQAGELVLRQPRVTAVREAGGRWQHEALLPASAPPSADPPWQIRAKGLRLEQGLLKLQDALAGDGVVQLDQIRLQLQDLAWPAAAQAMPAQLSLAVARAEGRPRGRTPAGSTVQWQGQVLLAPLGASGKLQVEKLPLQLLDPYLDRSWGVQLRRAELGLKGEFALAQKAEGWQLNWHGDASLARLRLNQANWQQGQRVIGPELLGWQTLDLGGLALLSRPGSPPEVTVALARLDDYYMRLDVSEKGRFNISDLGPQAQAEKAAAPAAAPASAPALQLTVGQVQFSKGEVDFSDHFIRPNYSARLSALEGSLGAFSTGRPAMAPLSLRGKVQGTGNLRVEGQLNPLGSPVTLDIKAHASDIELSPLSPYAAKYAGYAIERGKLSTQVEYKIDASGQLQASNRITLDKLSFGERVESAEATTLPVLLAVALLQDSNGVIDVDLPVSGSINDPDFSIGGLVFKLIGNLLGKALTAPFSLFSGGSDDADVSQAAFAPGGVTPSAPDQLDAVAKMLAERPALALTITGWADAGADGAALLQRQADAAADSRRQRELRRQQRGVLPAAEPASAIASTNAPAPAPAPAASAPTASTASEAQLQQLASERGMALRDVLIAKGIANSRLFLAAPRVTEGASPGWLPHADLSLSVR